MTTYDDGGVAISGDGGVDGLTITDIVGSSPLSGTSIVTALYEEIDFQAPSAVDIEVDLGQLAGGGISMPALISEIENSAFTVDVVDPIIREYLAAFGRLPDQSGLAYWVGVAAADPGVLSDLGTTFANSAEFAARYDGVNADTVGGVALVTALYENVLGRAPDQAGLDYWVDQHLTVGQLLQVFAQSAEFIADAAPAITAFEDLEAAASPVYAVITFTGSVFTYGTAGAPPAPSDFAIDTLGPLPTSRALDNFAILNAANTNSSSATVIQVGANPMLILSATGDLVLNTLTYGNVNITNDNPTLMLYANQGEITIDNLVDASNSGATLLVAGSHPVSVGAISDTALTTINAIQLDAPLEVAASQSGLSITGSLDGDTIVASGANNTIIVGSAAGAASNGPIDITATGGGDWITVFGGSGPDIAAPGANDTIGVADNGGVAYVTGNGEPFSSGGSQLGPDDVLAIGTAPNSIVGLTGYGGDVQAWLGPNANVSFSSGGSADLYLLGDTAGTSLTNLTTITGPGDGSLTLHFDQGNSAISTEAWAGGSIANSEVNVTAATSLASALNTAAEEAPTINGSAALAANTGLLDWFDYGGNTYVVEVNNTSGSAAAHAGLQPGDIVVELTGVVDLTQHIAFALV